LPNTEAILIMGRRPSLTLEQRSIAIGMFHCRMQAKAVAAHFCVAASTISRLTCEIGRVQTDQDQGDLRKRQLLLTVKML